MKKKEKIRGYLYWVFPVDYVVDINEAQLVDCWFNNTFFWLLELIDDFLGFLCYLTGIQKWLAIKFYGKNKKRLIELSKKNHLNE